MKENKLISICIILLSVSIIFGSVWIGNSIRDVNKDTNVKQSLNLFTNNKALMSDKETAEYLNMTQDKFNSLISNEELQRRKLGVYDTYNFIPFIKIDGVRYFNKEQVDKWIEYNITRDSEITTK